MIAAGMDLRWRAVWCNGGVLAGALLELRQGRSLGIVAATCGGLLLILNGLLYYQFRQNRRIAAGNRPQRR